MERNTVLKERLVLKKCIKRFISQTLLSIIISVNNFNSVKFFIFMLNKFLKIIFNSVLK